MKAISHFWNGKEAQFSRWGLVSNIESRHIEGVTGPALISCTKRKAEFDNGSLFRQHQGQLLVEREPQAQGTLSNSQEEGPSMVLALLTCPSQASGLSLESDVGV